MDLLVRSRIMEITYTLPATTRPRIKRLIKATLDTHPFLRASLALPLALRRAWIERHKQRFNRQFEETLGRASSGTLVMNIDNLGGEFAVDVRSSTTKRILREGNYEPDLVRLINRFVDRNHDAIDVGANIGLLSVFLSRYINANFRVLSVEPVPTAAALLKQNLQRNGCRENVVLFEGMAGAVNSTGEIHTIPGMEEYSSANGIHHAMAHAKGARRVKVPVRTLDSIVAEQGLAPGFLKIDTEGFELDVLRGAEQVLGQFRPVVFTEASDKLMKPAGHSVHELIELLESNNYHVSDAEAPGRKVTRTFDGELIALPGS